MLHGISQAFSHLAQCRRRIQNPLHIQTTHHHTPAFTFFTNPVSGRHLGIIKTEVAIIHPVIAHQLIYFLDMKSGCSLLDDKPGKVAIFRAVLRAFTGSQIGHIDICRPYNGLEPLFTVDNVEITIADSSGFYPGYIRTGIGFRHSDSSDVFTTGYLGQPSLPLFLSSIVNDLMNTTKHGSAQWATQFSSPSCLLKENSGTGDSPFFCLATILCWYLRPKPAPLAHLLHPFPGKLLFPGTPLTQRYQYLIGNFLCLVGELPLCFIPPRIVLHFILSLLPSSFSRYYPNIAGYCQK